MPLYTPQEIAAILPSIGSSTIAPDFLRPSTASLQTNRRLGDGVCSAQSSQRRFPDGNEPVDAKQRYDTNGEEMKHDDGDARGSPQRFALQRLRMR